MCFLPFSTLRYFQCNARHFWDCESTCRTTARAALEVEGKSHLRHARERRKSLSPGDEADVNPCDGWELFSEPGDESANSVGVTQAMHFASVAQYSCKVCAPFPLVGSFAEDALISVLDAVVAKVKRQLAPVHAARAASLKREGSLRSRSVAMPSDANRRHSHTSLFFLPQATFHGFPHPLVEEMMSQTASARKKLPPGGVAHVAVDIGRYLAQAYGLGLSKGAR